MAIFLLLILEWNGLIEKANVVIIRIRLILWPLEKLEKIKLKPGMVIAIEPMTSTGDWHVKTGKDGWTIVMADGSMCAHFEHTIVITETGNIVATRRPSEK